MKQELPHTHSGQKTSALLRHGMPEEAHFQTVADIFRLLDDPTRLRIFWTLCHTEECVINLASLLALSSPALSHHLKVLKSGNLIVSRRSGKEVYYKAADTETVAMLHKIAEQIMTIACPEEQTAACHAHDTVNLTEQEQIIHEVHGYLLAHLDERITIENLSHRFHLNSTTLKAAFKERFGTSIAAHIKEHRMEKAAELISSTKLSIGEIAKVVGYSSQSKFSVAFSETYGCLPLEFRKKN